MLLFCPEKIESILQKPAENVPTSLAAVRRLDHLRVRDEVSRRLEERRPLCGCPLEKLDRLLPAFGTFAHGSGLLSNCSNLGDLGLRLDDVEDLVLDDHADEHLTFFRVPVFHPELCGLLA